MLEVSNVVLNVWELVEPAAFDNVFSGVWSKH